jgi:acetyl esterase/lipase
MMKRIWMTVMLAGLAAVQVTRGAEPRTVVNLWPGEAPLEIGEFEEEGEPDGNAKAKRAVKRLTNVTEPRIEFYPAAKETNTGAAVVVAPGGAYNILAYEHEGTMVVDWLNSIGVNGILLKYRVPRRESETQKGYEAPLADAQRALRLVRLHAEAWGIDPKRVGMLGFSAGGHLTLAAGTNFDGEIYEKIDEADEESCRPDFLIPVYPAYLVFEGDEGELPSEIRVTDDTPPMFFAHAGDDKHSAEGSARVYIELRKRGIPAELHIYSSGGHGFGMMKDAKPVSTWPKRCEEWMREMGLLGQ